MVEYYHHLYLSGVLLGFRLAPLILKFFIEMGENGFSEEFIKNTQKYRNWLKYRILQKISQNHEYVIFSKFLQFGKKFIFTKTCRKFAFL